MKLEPCPFCGVELKRVDSIARALDQEKGGRPVWELHHERNNCILSGRSWSFDPITSPDEKFRLQWNTRCLPPASQSDELIGTAVSRDEADPNGYGAGTYIEQQTGPDNRSASNVGEGGSILPTDASQSDEALVILGQIPPFLSAPTFDDRAEQRVCINGCLYLRADFAGERHASAHAAGRREGIEEAAKGDSYAAWQQKRGMLADTVDWAILEYDEFMKDDAYDAQRVLDRIIERLRSTRSALIKEEPK